LKEAKKIPKIFGSKHANINTQPLWQGLTRITATCVFGVVMLPSERPARRTNEDRQYSTRLLLPYLTQISGAGLTTSSCLISSFTTTRFHQPVSLSPSCKSLSLSLAFVSCAPWMGSSDTWRGACCREAAPQWEGEHICLNDISRLKLMSKTRSFTSISTGRKGAEATVTNAMQAR
jgi:hypothetical protein